jgi:hypothetical protein
MSGIGDYWRQLSNGGVPIVHKAADGYGPLFEIVDLVPNPHNVEHHLVYRMSTLGQGDGYDYDVPPYHKTPRLAAEEHWQHTRDNLPKEFNREKVWVEPINEIDKNRCDWLGRFAFHIANLAQAEGYKVALFGWSSGEPEREGWETEGMLKYLRLCAERPKQAAVSVHEYDFGLAGFDAVYPHHVGRFQMLFDVCDNLGIARPTIHITEWGWSLRQIPPWEAAEQHITKANELYAKFPEVKGTAIWNLGKGPEFGNIHNQTQRLIEPLADYNLNRRFNAPEPGTQTAIDPILHQEPTQPQRQPSEPIRRTVVTAPETGRTETAPEQVSQPRTVRPSAQPNAQFVRDVNIPDDTRLTAGSSFTKTWRIRNNGNAAWQAGYRIVHVGGTAMTDRTSQPVPAIQPGQEADVSVTLVAPSTPGTYVSDWRFQDDRSNFFGTNVFTRIISEAAAPSPATGFSNSQYVADITIPDDTVMEPGQSFTKTWRLRNNGSRNWGAGFTAAFLNGTALTPTTSHPAPSAAANSDVNLSIPMTAPNEAGTYTSEWVLKDDQGNVFGTNFYTRIVVKKKLGIRPQVTLQTGMNINPDAPHSNPVDSDALRGMDWVRFVFKLAARENPAERDDINHAFAQYDPLIRKYNNKGVKSLIVLNQETVWGNAPWTGNNDWRTYGNQLARVARQIAERYREYGEQVAYEIWNEGDLPQNPASVFVEPEQFAVVLKIVAETIRVASPQSPLVFGGLATGPNQGIAYLHRCLKALGGIWPVDAIGIHPYGRWATRAPFDWGQQFGTLAQAFAEYENNFPDIPFWITEIGVAADNEIGSQHYAAVADYLTDVYQHIGEQHTHIAPVVIWFAWSDWMRNAGIVTQDGSHKAHVYDAFQAVIKSKDK